MSFSKSTQHRARKKEKWHDAAIAAFLELEADAIIIDEGLHGQAPDEIEGRIRDKVSFNG